MKSFEVRALKPMNLKRMQLFHQNVELNNLIQIKNSITTDLIHIPLKFESNYSEM